MDAEEIAEDLKERGMTAADWPNLITHDCPECGAETELWNKDERTWDAVFKCPDCGEKSFVASGS